MRLVHFTTTLADPEHESEHREMIASMRALAEGTPGFVEWRDLGSGDDHAEGLILFETEEGLAAWRDHPDHVEIHRRGREAVFGSFRVRIFEMVRESAWDRPGA